jgi:hypothetical protein
MHFSERNFRKYSDGVRHRELDAKRPASRAALRRSVGDWPAAGRPLDDEGGHR